MSREFFEAIKQGDMNAIRRMVSDDPSLVDSFNEQGLTAVLAAAYFQQPAIAQFFVEHGASLNLFESCAVGNLDKVKRLLEKQPDHLNAFAPDGFQPLGLAAFFGHTEVVRFLLLRGADVNTPSQNGLKVTPLNSAAAGGHLEIARLLLEHGADPNARQADDFVPLHAAAQNGQRDMVELLLKHKADKALLNKQGKSAYDIAVEAGHSALLELLK